MVHRLDQVIEARTAHHSSRVGLIEYTNGMTPNVLPAVFMSAAPDANQNKISQGVLARQANAA
jgi:hypothetical protein